jgi:hypothetical protein
MRTLPIARRRDRKEEVQTEILFEATFHVGIQLFLGAEVSEYAFLDEDRLESCKPKDDTTSEPTCEDDCNNLCCESPLVIDHLLVFRMRRY